MMKKAMFIIILSIVSLCCLAQQKHALIITISGYPAESGWSKINSDNDRTLLVPEFERLGFKVTTLTNEQATKQGITQSLSQLAKQVCKDDYVCIHFSCHGQQMEDDNQDEADGLDEALIPYDASLSLGIISFPANTVTASFSTGIFKCLVKNSKLQAIFSFLK